MESSSCLRRIQDQGRCASAFFFERLLQTTQRAVVTVTVLGVLGCSGEGDQPDAADVGRNANSDAQVANAIPAYVAINDEAAKQNGLIARAQLRNQVVEWYQPVDGLLVMSEAGIAADDTHPVTQEPELQNLTPTELYELLAGESAPEALKNIERRANRDLRLSAFTGVEFAERPGRPKQSYAAPAVRTESISEASGSTGNGCEETWFRNNFCNTGNYDVRFCRPDWWDGYRATINDLERAAGGVCTKSGTVRAWAAFHCSVGTSTGEPLACRDWGDWGTVQVPAGTWRSFTRTADWGGIFNADLEFQSEFHVSDALGDNFAAFSKGRKD